MAYVRDVKYYETDRMAIVHHSNYVRWFEEARIDLFEKMGVSYVTLENAGVMSPVVSVNCKYKATMKFGDKFSVETKVRSFNGITIVLDYEVTNLTTGKLACIGETENCFVTEKDFKLCNIKKWSPKLYERVDRYVTQEQYGYV